MRASARTNTWTLEAYNPGALGIVIIMLLRPSGTAASCGRRLGRGYLWLFVLRPAAWTVVECGSKFLGPLLIVVVVVVVVSRGTRTARRAGGAGSPQRGAVCM